MMTRIKNMFTWRPNSKRQSNRIVSDSVSFQSFRNESPFENQKPQVKESSLIKTNKLSCKSSDKNNYLQFSSKKVDSKCFEPNISTVLLACIVTILCLTLPVVYLLHSLGLIHVNEQISVLQSTKNIIHYEANNDVHWLLNKEFSPEEEPSFSEPPSPHPPDIHQCTSVEEKNKFDCFPEGYSNETVKLCEERGCCWKASLNNTEVPPLGVPFCFYPENFQSYIYINITLNSFGITAYLKRLFKGPYPNDINLVKMTVKFETDTRLHVKFTDPFHKRYEPPVPEVPVFDKVPNNLTYNFVIDPTKNGFKVVRKSDGTVLFDSEGLENFIFSDQFLQISSKLASNYIYGLGEHRSNLLLSTNWKRFNLFNHDSIPTESKNLYGSHPFYLVMEDAGKSHGVFLLNSNAMEIILQPTPAITFRALGGVLDFYVFTGPTPSDVIKQYTEIIGRPMLPPYWSLGFHFCRFGFKSLNETRKVWKRIIEAGIPFDTQWNDLDYMKNGNDFTLDEYTFGELPKFVEELHEKGMHYVPLIDPGISGSEKPGSYPPYDKGIEMDIFVKNSSGQPFIGKVWNNQSTVWPDFTHPRIVEYWTSMMKSMHQMFQFDGAWIDMNEPSNFLSGSFNGCSKNNLDDPPYVIPLDGDKLFYKTICMSANHFLGKHYDLHNIFGLTEAIATNFALTEIRGKRPMIISRSTFPGLGHYAGHWSGDVVSSWYDMKYTIPELLSFSMFGIPLMGADICGFNGNTTAALCNRWMQLGAFYPFSRNHNTDDGIDQDPVALGQLVVESSRKALKVRYSLLPYLYTLFWYAHSQGSTVATPMFFEFPEDKNTYSLDEQFLWGPAVLILPVLEENKVSVTGYFPSGVWYDFYSRKPLISKGQTFNIPAPLDTIPVFIRGGYVLPMQQPLATTTASRKTKIEILVAPDQFGSGVGQLYWDDGDSLNTLEEKKYSLINFILKPGILMIEHEWWAPEFPPNLGKVTVLGVVTPISKVSINNVDKPFHYNATNQFLEINLIDLSFKSKILVSWL